MLGKRSGGYAARFAAKHDAGSVDERQVEQAVERALAPFERAASKDADPEGPYRIQYQLQQTMQNLVGIVRTEAEMRRAPR